MMCSLHCRKRVVSFHFNARDSPAHVLKQGGIGQPSLSLIPASRDGLVNRNTQVVGTWSDGRSRAWTESDGWDIAVTLDADVSGPTQRSAIRESHKADSFIKRRHAMAPTMIGVDQHDATVLSRR